MTRQTGVDMIRIERVIGILLVAIAFAGCSRIEGQLVFVEDSACTSAVPFQQTKHTQCHYQKHRLSPSGNKLIAETNHIPNALRPLASQVLIVYSMVDERTGNTRICDQRLVQTDDYGKFDVSMWACNKPGPKWLSMFVYLRYKITDARFQKRLDWEKVPPESTGTVQAIWKKKDAETVFSSLGGLLAGEFHSKAVFKDKSTYGNDEYTIPGFHIRQEIEEPTFSRQRLVATHKLGLLDVFRHTRFSGRRLTYLREMVSGFTSVVELNLRFLEELQRFGRGAEFFQKHALPLDQGRYTFLMTTADPQGKQFPGKVAPDRERYINLRLQSTWPLASGNRLFMFGPKQAINPDISHWRLRWGLSSIGVLSHEFGHTVHSALAPNSGDFIYRFAARGRRPDPLPANYKDRANVLAEIRKKGRDYGVGHSNSEYQEMGTALGEGLADTIGQYMITACRDWSSSRRPVGGVDPFVRALTSPVGSGNQWAADNFDDGVGDGSNFHHVRWHLSQRNIAEGSAEFNRRVGLLRALSARARQVGHRFITTNNEARYAQFGCDLLDSDTSTTHAASTKDKQYLDDFTFNAARILNGDVPGSTLPATVGAVRKFEGAMAAETIEVDFLELLKAMANICGTGCAFPKITEKGFAEDRVSYHASHQSPLRLGAYLLHKKQITNPGAFSNLLRSNFMEPKTISAQCDGLNLKRAIDGRSNHYRIDRSGQLGNQRLLEVRNTGGKPVILTYTTTARGGHNPIRLKAGQATEALNGLKLNATWRVDEDTVKINAPSYRLTVCYSLF